MSIEQIYIQHWWGSRSRTYDNKLAELKYVPPKATWTNRYQDPVYYSGYLVKFKWMFSFSRLSFRITILLLKPILTDSRHLIHIHIPVFQLLFTHFCHISINDSQSMGPSLPQMVEVDQDLCVGSCSQQQRHWLLLLKLASSTSELALNSSWPLFYRALF